MIFDLDDIVSKRPITDIFSVGFLTGSRVFGGATKESDWDIVVSIIHRQEAEEIIKSWSYNKKESNYFAGITYCVDLKPNDYTLHKINLIFVHPHEFKAWYLATKALENTLPLVGTIFKKNRTSIFQTLMIQFRSILPELGDFKNYAEENKKCLPKAPYSKAEIAFLNIFGSCK